MVSRPQPTVGLEAVQCRTCSSIFRSLQEPALSLAARQVLGGALGLESEWDLALS